MDPLPLWFLTAAFMAMIGVLGYVSRRFVDRLFDHSSERYRAEIRSVHDVEMERLRVQLQSAAFEHQTRFSHLHERRIEVLGEVYRRLGLAHRAFQSWTNPLQMSGEPSMQEKAVAARDRGNELTDYFDSNRIWMPAALCIDLDRFLGKLRRINMVTNQSLYNGTRIANAAGGAR